MYSSVISEEKKRNVILEEEKIRSNVFKLITTTADDTWNFYFYFSEKIRLHISYGSSAIHVKNQVLFHLKNKKINFRMSSATNVLSASRVNIPV